MTNILKITDEASNQLKKIIDSSPPDTIGVIVGIDQAGCNGYSYKLDLAKKNEVDNLLLKINEKISRRPAARPGILVTSSKDKFGIDLLRCLIYRIIKH